MSEGKEFRKAFALGATVLASGVLLERGIKLCTFSNLHTLVMLARRAIVGHHKTIIDPLLDAENPSEEVARPGDPMMSGPLLSSVLPPPDPPFNPSYQEGVFTKTYEEMLPLLEMQEKLKNQGSALDGKTFIES